MKIETLEWNERSYLYRLILEKEQEMKKSVESFKKSNAYDNDMLTILKSKLLGKNISQYLKEHQIQLELLRMRDDDF